MENFNKSDEPLTNENDSYFHNSQNFLSQLNSDEVEVKNLSNAISNFMLNEKKFNLTKRKIHSSPIKGTRRYSQDSGIGVSSNGTSGQVNYIHSHSK